MSAAKSPSGAEILDGLITGTKMSDASIGAMLGKSASAVARRRRALIQAAAVEPASPITPSAMIAPPPMPAKSAGLPCAPRPRRRSQRRPRSFAAIERLTPATPAKLRFAGWFLRAGWSIEETAALFDLAPEALGE